VCRRRLTGASTPTLRDRTGRTESSGNVGKYWGYLAEEHKTDGVNQQGVGVRRERVWLPKTDTDPKLRMENFSRVTFSIVLTKTIISDMRLGEPNVFTPTVSPFWLTACPAKRRIWRDNAEFLALGRTPTLRKRRYSWAICRRLPRIL
jgi:hypothetical protein